MSSPPSAELLTVFSTRRLSVGPSSEVINRGEDALSRHFPAQDLTSLNASQVLVRRLLRNRYAKRLPATAQLYERVQRLLARRILGSALVTILNPGELDVCGWMRTTGKSVLFAIDVWESDIPRVARAASQMDIVLMAYADSAEMLKARLGRRARQKVHLFPNFVDHEYYDFDWLPKRYDLVQVGRQDPVLHEWALKYAAERKRSYLYQKRSSRGIYYYDTGEWDLPGVQLSYRNLMSMLASSSIALVSPPDRSDPVRTGRVSPLTHRYLEAAMCGTIPIGFTPSGAEYVDSFPATFTGGTQDYESFGLLCDSLLEDRDERGRWAAANRAFVARAHSAKARAAQLKEILQAEP